MNDIRTANTGDIPVIIDIEEKVWLTTYPNPKIGITKQDIGDRFGPIFKKNRAKEIASEITSGRHCYKIIAINDKAVGYSHLLKEKRFNDFVELYILDRHQGKGFGTALLKNGLIWLGKDKFIQLEVATYNTRAISFYQHHGFVNKPDLHQTPEENWNLLPSGIKIPVIFMIFEP